MADKKGWEIRLNRTHLFLIILIIVASSGAAFTLGNMLGKGQADKAAPIESMPAYNIGKHLRDKEVSSQKEDGGGETVVAEKVEERRVNENDLTFYRTLTLGKPAPVVQNGAVKQDMGQKGNKATPPEPLKAESPHQKELKSPLGKNGGEAYIIQIGAFKNESEANAFIRKMEQKGYKPYLVPFVKDGATWYRVRVGTAKKVEEARRLAGEIYDKENIKAIIVRLR
ncbi:MAG: SPOR domain-containing protein [Nitrospinota bacterium]|nr:SPOR domain-containing protein [Nitrospinota bacterium]